MSTLSAQSATDAMAEYVQQLEQQLAASQKSYELLQTLQTIG
ncbi:hypothetical protein [Hymenobacter sp. BT559]|nr:hypothetical protein [Hymenobacter sp. BT559]